MSGKEAPVVKCPECGSGVFSDGGGFLRCFSHHRFRPDGGGAAKAPKNPAPPPPAKTPDAGESADGIQGQGASALAPPAPPPAASVRAERGGWSNPAKMGSVARLAAEKRMTTAAFLEGLARRFDTPGAAAAEICVRPKDLLNALTVTKLVSWRRVREKMGLPPGPRGAGARSPRNPQPAAPAQGDGGPGPGRRISAAHRPPLPPPRRTEAAQVASITVEGRLQVRIALDVSIETLLSWPTEKSRAVMEHCQALCDLQKELGGRG